MDCGYRGQTLRRHINTRHNMTRDAYLKRWGLRSDHPLNAPAYSERRSTLAKALGLGRKAVAQGSSAAMATASVPVDTDGNSEAKPIRRRSPRSGSKAEDLANDAPTAPTLARKRRSRARAARFRPNNIPRRRRFSLLTSRHGAKFRKRPVGSLSRGGRNRKGWLRISATNMEILNRRLELTGYGKLLV
jgi:hypothetical protein